MIIMAESASAISLYSQACQQKGRCKGKFVRLRQTAESYPDYAATHMKIFGSMTSLLIHLT